LKQVSLPGKAGIGNRVVTALSEFEARPGRYSLVMREPSVLFDNARAVLTLALGRPVPELYIDAAQAASSQGSARFFVRTAFLRNGADHYTHLGLWPGFSEAELRDHYRLMMRLTHPDFVAGDPLWPTDAAARVNKASEVLSSPTLKAEYDRSLNQSSGARPMPAWHTRPATHKAHAYGPRTPSWVWAGGAGVLVVLGGLWAFFHDWAPPVEVVSMNMEEFSAAASKRSPAPLPASVPMPATVPEPAPLPPVASAPAAVPEPVPPPPPAPVVATVAPAVVAVPAPTPAPAPVPVEVVKPERKTARELKLEREEKRRLEAEQRRALALAKVQSLQPKPPVVVAVAAPSPAPGVAPTPPPALAPVAAPTPPVVAAAAPVPAPAPAPRLTVAEIQPAFLVLLQGMQTGNPDAITRGLDRAVRQSDSTAHLLRVYKHLVGEASAVRIGQVQLRGRPDGEQFVVDGVVQLLLPESGSAAPVRELRMKAVFVRQAGQVVVTQLAAGG
jgi:hypothetical protein